MRLSFHPLVQKDINAILRRYDAISTKLGDQFFAELTAAFDSVLRNPQKGHPWNLRRSSFACVGAAGQLISGHEHDFSQ